MKQMICSIMHQRRIDAHLSSEDTCAALAKRGIILSTEDLHRFENSERMLDINTFISLCDIYRIYHCDYFAPGTIDETVLWTQDRYEDYFHTDSLLQKVYLLKRDGVPTFDEHLALWETDRLIGSLSLNDHAMIAAYHAAPEEIQHQIDALLCPYQSLDSAE